MDKQPTGNRINRREFLKRAGVVAGAAALAGCAAPTPEVIRETIEVEKEVEVEVTRQVEVEVPVQVTAEVPTLEPAELSIWINWGGVWQAAIEQIVAGFKVEYPQIEVELLPGQSGSEAMTKFLASIAGGNPPDLYSVHASQGYMLLSRDVLLPLDSYMDGSRVKREDFFESQLGNYIDEGKLYGIPSIEGAAGQAIIWNKDHFAEVGLDPEVGPKTYDEIVEFSEMLDQFDAAGNLVRLGFDPRDARGADFLGWWFERKWYDAETAELKLNTDNMVWGAEWVADFARRIGPEKMTAFRQEYATWTGSPQSGFVRKAQSMIMSGYYVPGELARLAPELKAGYTWVPTLDNKKVTTIYGWFWAMPKGCPNPDQAWKYIEHATSVEAAYTLFNVAGGYPSYIPFLEVADFSKYEGLQWFVDSPFESDDTYIAPPLPISAEEVTDRLKAGLDEMSFGRVSGQEMLDQAQEEVQVLIDQAIAAM
jgi:multiple sugar transport system substrate-binding protein